MSKQPKQCKIGKCGKPIGNLGHSVRIVSIEEAKIRKHYLVQREEIYNERLVQTFSEFFGQPARHPFIQFRRLVWQQKLRAEFEKRMAFYKGLGQQTTNNKQRGKPSAVKL